MARPIRWRRVKRLINRAEIALGNGGVALIDLADIPLVESFGWFRENNGYARARCPKTRKQVVMHRIVMGVLDPKQFIDHKNRNRLDNRRSNLRFASHAENMRNRPCLLRGVTFAKDRGLWRARITINHEVMWLGDFKDRNEALAVRRAAEQKYFGEFAFPNLGACLP